MKTTWIDLTDISTWEGHHTGTQRVVYQIAKRYHGKPGVKYFIFDPRHNTFHEHSFDGILERIEQSERQEESEPAEPPKPPLIRHLLIRTYHRSPEALRKKLTPHRRKQIKRVYKKTKQILTRSEAAPTVAAPTTPAMHFTADDTVLIMGKPWDYPSFIETLRKDKIQHKFKIVQVVYDLIPIMFPHLFGIALFKPYTQHIFETVAISDGLLAISESTKRDTEKFCEESLVKAPPIEVIRLGDDFAKVKPKKPPIESLEPGNFILCVGTVEVRKNHQLLYAAYKLGLSRGRKLPKLVIVGGKGWYTGDILYAFKNDPELRDMVFVDRSSDQELEWLYQNCKFTIYPSVYEGWGLPIAESLARGKVCIASDTSSMTEIAGNLIDYFSPYDSAACLALISKYLDQNKLADKVREIQNEYKPRTWNQTQEQVQSFVEGISKTT